MASSYSYTVAYHVPNPLSTQKYFVAQQQNDRYHENNDLFPPNPKQAVRKIDVISIPKYYQHHKLCSNSNDFLFVAYSDFDARVCVEDKLKIDNR